jgi:hypothetical protein
MVLMLDASPTEVGYGLAKKRRLVSERKVFETARGRVQLLNY